MLIYRVGAGVAEWLLAAGASTQVTMAPTMLRTARAHVAWTEVVARIELSMLEGEAVWTWGPKRAVAFGFYLHLRYTLLPATCNQHDDDPSCLNLHLCASTMIFLLSSLPSIAWNMYTLVAQMVSDPGACNIPFGTAV